MARHIFIISAVSTVTAASLSPSTASFSLDYAPAVAPLAAGLDSLWGSCPQIDHNLEPNASSKFYLNVSTWAAGSALLGWVPPRGATLASPLRQRTSTVRLLGGWGPSTPPGPPGSVAWPDVVYVDAAGALQWRWLALWQRLDDLVVGALMDLTLVLDNVPYALAQAGGAVSRYGQVLGPSNATAYGDFIRTLVEALVARYGVDVASRWQWRVGTEPNTKPGHWNSTVDAYLAMYAAVARAVRAVLPNAPVGPGNWCPFAPGVGCSDTATTIVYPMLDGLVAQGSPVDFLASSHYGAYTRTRLGDPQVGYDPVWGARNALDLVALQQRHPAVLAHVPLSFQEFGTLANSPAGGINNEPGAFGAAWRLATTAAAGVRGVRDFFDWGASGPDGALAEDGSAPVDLGRLVYTSSTILRAFAWTARNASGAAALVARGGGAETHCFPELELAAGVCIVPRSSGDPGAVQVAGIAAVAGSAADAPPQRPLAAAQLGPAAAGTVVVLATAFSVHRNSTESAQVTIAFACPPQWGAGACAAATPAPPALAVVLDASTCLYDVALAQAVRNGTNKTSEFLVNSLSDMVTPKGLNSMRDNAAWWVALQAASLQPRPASSAGVALACSAGQCTASATLMPPAVWALWVGPQ